MSDGRQESSLLLDASGSPARSPSYQLWGHRTANDTNANYLANKTARHGIAFGEAKTGLIQAVPRNGATLASTPGGADTVTLTEYEWSEAAAAFVPTGVTKVAAGAGRTIVFSVDACGRILYYAVTGLSTLSVSIYAAAFYGV